MSHILREIWIVILTAEQNKAHVLKRKNNYYLKTQEQKWTIQKIKKNNGYKIVIKVGNTKRYSQRIYSKFSISSQHSKQKYCYSKCGFLNVVSRKFEVTDRVSIMSCWAASWCQQVLSIAQNLPPIFLLSQSQGHYHLLLVLFQEPPKRPLGFTFVSL